MHGRSRMTIDPRIPTMQGRTRQTLLEPSAKRREVFGESHEGKLHPSENRSQDFLADG